MPSSRRLSRKMPRGEAKKRYARNEERKRATDMRREEAEIITSQTYLDHLFEILRNTEGRSARIAELSEQNGDIADELVSTGLLIIKDVKKVFENLRKLNDFSLKHPYNTEVCKNVIYGFQYGVNIMELMISSYLKICNITQSQEWLNHSNESIDLIGDMGDLLESYRLTMNFDENVDQEYIDPINGIFDQINNTFDTSIPIFIECQKGIEGAPFLKMVDTFSSIKLKTREMHNRIESIIETIENGRNPYNEEGREPEHEIRELYNDMKKEVKYILTECSVLEKIINRKNRDDPSQKDIIAYMYGLLVLGYGFIAESIFDLIETKISLSYHFYEGDLDEKRKYLKDVEMYSSVLKSFVKRVEDITPYLPVNEVNREDIMPVIKQLQQFSNTAPLMIRRAKKTPSLERENKERRNLYNQRKKAVRNLSNRRNQGVGGRRTRRK